MARTKQHEEQQAVAVVSDQIMKLSIGGTHRGLSKSKRANILERGRSHISAANKSSNVSTKLIAVALADQGKMRTSGGKFFVFPLSGHGHIVVVYGAHGSTKAAIIAKLFGGSSGNKFAVVRQVNRTSKKTGKSKKSDVLDIIKVTHSEKKGDFKIAHRGFKAEKVGSITGKNLGAVRYSALKSAAFKRVRGGHIDRVRYDMVHGRVRHNKKSLSGFGRKRKSPKGHRKSKSPRKIRYQNKGATSANMRKFIEQLGVESRKAKRSPGKKVSKSPRKIRYQKKASTSGNMRKYMAGMKKSGSSSRRRHLGIPKAPALRRSALKSTSSRRARAAAYARSATSSRSRKRVSARPATPIAPRRGTRVRKFTRR